MNPEERLRFIAAISAKVASKATKILSGAEIVEINEMAEAIHYLATQSDLFLLTNLMNLKRLAGIE